MKKNKTDKALGLVIEKIGIKVFEEYLATGDLPAVKLSTSEMSLLKGALLNSSSGKQWCCGCRNFHSPPVHNSVSDQNEAA